MTERITFPHSRAPRLASGAIAMAAVLALSACATREPPPELDQARTMVNTAASNPEVARRAPLELKNATDALARADSAWQKDADGPEARHQAYLARQSAATATALTQARTAEDQMKDANAEADRLRLNARTREAEAARGQAAAAQAQVGSAQAQAAQANAQAAQANARAAALEARLKELQAQQTDRGLLVTLGDVLFEFGKAQLLPTAGPRLDTLADFLKQYPDRRLLIEGHTDSVGSDATNLTLSERRAQAVQQALTMRGVDASRITTRGYGKSYPVASNATPEGRALNRRVEVVIADERGTLRSR